MGNPLRDRRTPSELAASGQVIEFEEKISEFERLAAIVENDLATLDPDRIPGDWRETRVSGRLGFGFADAQNGLPVLEGRVAVTVAAVCQRCLEVMQLPLDAELRLLFGGDESTLANDAGFEGWELEQEQFRPVDIVEEALIMAMPLAAVHVDDGTCKGRAAAPAQAGEKIRPFADLKSQMDKGIE